MSTRALYTFKAGTSYDHDWNIYKHHDGYPTGAADTLAVAQAWFAWKEPRYESDEFACAFITAGKAWMIFNGAELQLERAKEYVPGGTHNLYTGGGVRLMPQGTPSLVASENCADIEYRYEVFQKFIDKAQHKSVLFVTAFAIKGERYEGKKLFTCRLKDFPAKAKAWEAEHRVPFGSISAPACWFQ
jgi:hypothetical protein